MGFFSFFRRENLLFWAIMLDLACDCIDFAVAFDNQRQHRKNIEKQKKDKRDKLEELEQRSRDLESEVELLKMKLLELTKEEKS
ncbi:hypothetical protein [Dendrosporobacter sp. 1207_IL3150]|uniref:hypothetical protein n=1 Tax=Dendrosporobacter sp. 1207_IL3150 TaxID=3084054 RepID=UPI002FDA2877